MALASHGLSFLKVLFKEAVDFIKWDLIQLVVQINVVGVWDDHQIFLLSCSGISSFTELTRMRFFIVAQQD